MADPSKANKAYYKTLGFTFAAFIMIMIGIILLTLVISSQADSSDSTNSSDGENNSSGCTQDQYYLWWQVVALILIGAAVIPALFAGSSKYDEAMYTYKPSADVKFDYSSYLN